MKKQFFAIMMIALLAVATLTGCPSGPSPTPQLVNSSSLWTAIDQQLAPEALSLDEWNTFLYQPQSGSQLFVEPGAKTTSGTKASVKWKSAKVDYQMAPGDWGGQTISYKYEAAATDNDNIVVSHHPTFVGPCQSYWYYPQPYYSGYLYPYNWPVCGYIMKDGQETQPGFAGWTTDGPDSYYPAETEKEKSASALDGNSWLRIVPDSDQDRIMVTVEFEATTAAATETKKFTFLVLIDSDGDGFANYAEREAGTDPFDPNSQPNGDGTTPEGYGTADFRVSGTAQSVSVDLGYGQKPQSFFQDLPAGDVSIGFRVFSPNTNKVGQEIIAPWVADRPVVLRLSDAINQGDTPIKVAFVARHKTKANPNDPEGLYWGKIWLFNSKLNGQVLEEARDVHGNALGYYLISIDWGTPTPTTFTLTTSVSGQGSVSVSTAGPYTNGATPTLTANPASGWHFDHWTGDAAGSLNPISVIMDRNKTVTAVFVQNTAQQYTLTTAVSGQGSISLSATGPYSSGSTPTLTANPASGWHLDHWEGDATGSLNSISVIMDRNKSVTAVFVQDTVVTGRLVIDLYWSNNQLSYTLSAPDGYPAAAFGGCGTSSSVASAGLEFYHQTGGSPWIERQTFAVNTAWPASGNVASGVLTKFRPNMLRFEAVANTSGGYGDPNKLLVRLHTSAGVKEVTRVADTSGNVAYQVDVSQN